VIPAGLLDYGRLVRDQQFSHNLPSTPDDTKCNTTASPG
jgi:hypothetical protein